MGDKKEEKAGVKPRVVVIGLDGGTYALLDPLMQEGRMPVLKSLVDRGARGVLRTVIPPITPAAWSTFMTGKNPGKHGILEFQVRDGDGESPVNARLRRGKTIWRLLNEAGLKIVSCSVPTTYPPEPVDGFLVSSFLTPLGKKDYGYPPELLKEVEDKFGPYHLYIREVYAPGRVDKVLAELEEDLRYKFDAASWLRDKVDWRLFVLHVFGTDRLQHELWHLIDPTHPLHRKDEAQKYADRFWKFYEDVDWRIGRFIEGLGEDDTVIVMSDHGFGPVHRFLNFNIWHMERGYLKLRRHPWTRIKHLLFRAGMAPKNAYRLAMKLGLARLRLSIGVSSRVRFFNIVDRILLSLRDIDWERTTAFSKGYYGQIHINLKGRQPHGSVDPADYNAVRERIISDLEAIEDPETGKRIIGEIYRREDIYHGPFLKEAPDISFLPSDMSYKAIGTAAFTSNKFLEPAYANSADHRMEGILIARGPQVRRTDSIQAWIGDMAPTLLYLLGQPVPDDMDGKVITSMIEPAYLDSHPVRYVHAEQEEGGEGSGYTEEEKEGIRKRLKDMGYM